MTYAFAATIFYYIREYASKKFLTEKELSKYSLLFYMRFYGMIPLIFISLTNSSLLDFSYLRSSTLTIGVLVAILTGLSGLILFYEVLSRVELTSFSIIKSLAPLVTVFMGLFIFGETYRTSTFVGIFIIIVAMILFNRNSQTDNTASESSYKYHVLLILSYFLMGLGNHIYHYYSSSVSSLTYTVTLSIVNIVIFFFYLLVKERKVLRQLFTLNLKLNLKLIALGIIANLAMLALNEAYRTISPSIVNIILQLQIVLIFISGLNEINSRKTLIRGSGIMLLSVFGVVLMSI